MALRVLFYILLVACATGVPTTSAQSNPSGEVSSSRPMQPTIDRLLQLTSDALDHFQQVLAPALRCDQADKNYRETCHGMSVKLSDDAQTVQKDIARYRASRTPADLFDIYAHLQFFREGIDIFSVADEYNGDHNHLALAKTYNSFVKLTEGGFACLMKQIIGSCAH